MKNLRCLCEFCGSKFSNYQSLDKHNKKKHTNHNTSESKRLNKTYKYNCGKCKAHFNNIQHFKFHQKVHNIYNPPYQIKCPLCQKQLINRANLIQHITKNHKMKIDTECLKFDTLDDFNKWKDNLEKETHSKYIKARGSKTKKTHVKIEFICHRSGNYEQKGTGIRRIKTQGSHKINGTCPATIRVIINKNNECQIYFTKNHVGHQQDVDHLPLSKSDRNYLAAQIATEVPLADILNKVPDLITGDTLERIHLLTKKDLYNLKNAYNISTTRAKNDNITFENWINVMQNTNDSPILFYKPQGKLLPECSTLNSKDFLLIIMNNGQLAMLQKYGHNCICLDRTNELNCYGFELFTILVIDDLQQGFACAFLITNRTDKVALSTFFSCIKIAVGTLTPKIYMSSKLEFYKTWELHMGKSNQCETNMNVHIKRVCYTLKYIYGHYKNQKLHKFLQVIMKFIRDKLIDHILVLHKGKIACKVKELEVRHKQSLQLNLDSITKNENDWEVLSKSGAKYIIEQIKNTCDCQLRCQDCNTCSHVYSCTCIDSSVKWNMCQHIHLICRFQSTVEDPIDYTFETVSEEQSLVDIDYTNTEYLIIEEPICKPIIPTEIDTQKQNISYVSSLTSNGLKVADDVITFLPEKIKVLCPLTNSEVIDTSLPSGNLVIEDDLFIL